MNKAGMGDRSSDSLGLDLRSRRSTIPSEPGYSSTVLEYLRPPSPSLPNTLSSLFLPREQASSTRRAHCAGHACGRRCRLRQDTATDTQNGAGIALRAAGARGQHWQPGEGARGQRVCVCVRVRETESESARERERESARARERASNRDPHH